MTPRRICPACSRRYAQLVDADCPICKGLGVLNLGAAALHHYDPAPVARAIEFYLESKARRTRAELPLGQHRDTLAEAVDELRLAGVLSDGTGIGPPARTPPPRDASSARIAELDSYRVARALGTPVSTPVVAALAAPPVDDLATLRPRNGHAPTGSLNGHRSALATIADPIDPLGPDTATIAADRYADGHRARVIAAAVPTAATRRSTRP
jgi:hypothetical protein